ncbi:saccharopine dehydrogenase NADP-binding domain-containing protein [Ornithinimicrobium avium]|uniref:Semialdehyde dehydrogenase n=1 Tax=Ornithinimicrobium avium TaxID=2283195 RepID=A0A345NN77_9MICO|nr:semialdehyde dehydrogenase [Ornithinimicrobium avium]AXH96485.1 semialdehyde dehydrogenase [Ornithinimicrobium avium]
MTTSTTDLPTGAGTFAFLVHPRARIADDLGRVWAPLGSGPERLYDLALRRLPLPPVRMAGVEVAGQRVGDVVLVPFGAKHLLEQPGEGRRRVAAAVDRAAGLGADVVGLGALTATVTAGGVSLRDRTDVGVTNGNAFTASTVDLQARLLLGAAVDQRADRHVAVVGATGSVGGAVAALLARDAAVDRLTLVARSRPRLEALVTRLDAICGGRVDTRATDDLAEVGGADLVILLTASTSAIIGPEHLAAGAVVLDATQPRNTSPTLLEQRPDVTVVDGGVVEIPSLRLLGGNIGLPDGRAYACFAETALLALSGHRGHFSLGVPTLEQVDRTRELAHGLAHLGFGAAPPTSFGRPVDLGTAPRPVLEAGR